MSISDYGRHDALGLAELVRRGEVSASELLDEALDRVQRHNPSINAVVHLMEGPARAAIAAGLPEGPFRGVPFLVKDLIQACAGEPMSCGSRAMRQFVPVQDEELVRRFRAAGLVIFGKTNTPEFGLSPSTEPELFGPTCNPWDLARSPSGSSGGSAAAVAARFVPAAGANDGGGSIRTPASNCGLVGLKPSRGRNPTGPAMPEPWWGFVVDHVLTRSVRDCAAFLDATAGPQVGQWQLLPRPVQPWLAEVGLAPAPLRVGLSFGPGLGRVLHPENREALRRTAAALEDLGHRVIEVEPPLDREPFIEDFAKLLAADTATMLDAIGAQRGKPVRRAEVEPSTWMLGRLGHALHAADMGGAWWSMQQFARRWLEWADGFDVLVTPTVGVPPLPTGALQPRFTDRLGMSLMSRMPGAVIRASLRQLLEAFEPTFEASPYTMQANVTGQPSMSLPLHWTAEGLPMGVLFTARRGDEATLFQLAGQLEQALPWRDRLAPHAAS